MVSPEDPSFAFFAWLAHVSLKLAERILSSLSADKRSPEGLGLERMRGASYTLDVPAKQKRVLWLSRTGNKLQVEVAAHDPFDGVGNLAVQPSLKPRDGKPVGHEDQRARIGYFDKGCSGKPCFCLSNGKV